MARWRRGNAQHTIMFCWPKISLQMHITEKILNKRISVNAHIKNTPTTLFQINNLNVLAVDETSLLSRDMTKVSESLK